MRVLFIMAVALIIWLSGCANRHYIDLRKPIYFVTEDSFFLDCDKDPLGEEFCRESRSQKIKDGVAQWLDYFQDSIRPSVNVVADKNDVPRGADNLPIHLSVDKGACKEAVENPLACFSEGGSFVNTRIIFTDTVAENIAPHVMAHEFGHALGLDHYDNANGTKSIMSSSIPLGGSVAESDIDRLCKIHDECPARKQVAKDAKSKK